jgi:hypothetical protein
MAAQLVASRVILSSTELVCYSVSEHKHNVSETALSLSSGGTLTVGSNRQTLRYRVPPPPAEQKHAIFKTGKKKYFFFIQIVRLLL